MDIKNSSINKNKENLFKSSSYSREKVELK